MVKIGSRQIDLLRRFVPEEWLSMEDGHVKIEYKNIRPSRRKDKPWWPEMDSLIKRGLLCVRRKTTETLMGDDTFYKDSHWQAATSWKGIQALKDLTTAQKESEK